MAQESAGSRAAWPDGPARRDSRRRHFLSGFLLFGLLTSGTYIINDILDVEADRTHPRKATRPIASGELPCRSRRFRRSG